MLRCKGGFEVACAAVDVVAVEAGADGIVIGAFGEGDGFPGFGILAGDPEGAGEEEVPVFLAEAGFESGAGFFDDFLVLAGDEFCAGVFEVEISGAGRIEAEEQQTSE